MRRWGEGRGEGEEKVEEKDDKTDDKKVHDDDNDRISIDNIDDEKY